MILDCLSIWSNSGLFALFFQSQLQHWVVCTSSAVLCGLWFILSLICWAVLSDLSFRLGLWECYYELVIPPLAISTY